MIPPHASAIERESNWINILRPWSITHYHRRFDEFAVTDRLKLGTIKRDSRFLRSMLVFVTLRRNYKELNLLYLSVSRWRNRISSRRTSDGERCLEAIFRFLKLRVEVYIHHVTGGNHAVRCNVLAESSQEVRTVGSTIPYLDVLPLAAEIHCFAR